MIGSECMVSSTWMPFALSSMGQGVPEKTGRLFVEHILKENEIHHAVVLMLSLKEYENAIEIYLSRQYFVEPILLSCLKFPTDWQRQSDLLQKWCNAALLESEEKLAYKCSSCIELISSRKRYSLLAQDVMLAAQGQHLLPACDRISRQITTSKSYNINCEAAMLPVSSHRSVSAGGGHSYNPNRLDPIPETNGIIVGKDENDGHGGNRCRSKSQRQPGALYTEKSPLSLVPVPSNNTGEKTVFNTHGFVGWKTLQDRCRFADHDWNFEYGRTNWSFVRTDFGKLGSSNSLETARCSRSKNSSRSGSPSKDVQYVRDV